MDSGTVTPFLPASDPPVRGFLHAPANANGNALALTHGAGGNCQGKLLLAVAEVFAAAGFLVLRFDLPFRMDRRFGPPLGTAERDRDGLRCAVTLLREKTPGRVYLGGHSYGGRQASMLVAEEPRLVEGLLLLSYPLHPPKKPQQPRTAHFPNLERPCFFVHGTRDPFGSVEEMHAALSLLPAPHRLLEVEGGAHDLLLKKSPGGLPSRIAGEFQIFLRDSG